SRTMLGDIPCGRPLGTPLGEPLPSTVVVTGTFAVVGPPSVGNAGMVVPVMPLSEVPWPAPVVLVDGVRFKGVIVVLAAPPTLVVVVTLAPPIMLVFVIVGPVAGPVPGV